MLHIHYLVQRGRNPAHLASGPENSAGTVKQIQARVVAVRGRGTVAVAVAVVEVVEVVK